MNIKKILFFAIAALFISLSLASSTVTEPNIFRYSEILGLNQYNDTAIPITNASVIGFVCSSTNCTTVSGALDLSSGNVIADISNPPVLNSGSSDQVNIVYPTTLQSAYGYGIYVYKDGYIPFESLSTLAGNNPEPEYTNYLSKKKSCSAPIENFTMLNDVSANLPLIMDVNASLDADTQSALKFTPDRILGYLPPTLISHYAVNTSITLKITNSTGQIVLTNTTYAMINYSGTAHIRFNWTPEINGTYAASAITRIPDAKCLSYTTSSQSKGFMVWNESPRNACYTIINGLSANPLIGEAGAPIEFKYNKTSNFANDTNPWDPNYLLPIATNVTYRITNSTNDVVFINASTLPANPSNSTPATYNFSWTPASVGVHNITIIAIASNPLCGGLANPAESISFDNLGVLDTVPPSITITYPSNGHVFATTTIVANGTASDNIGLSKVEVSVNGGSFQIAAGTSVWNVSLTLILGSNIINARATDTSGNTNNVSVTVSSTALDSTPPIMSVVSPQNTTYNTSSVWANVTLDEAGSWCGASLNNALNRTLSNTSLTAWYLNLSTLSEGANNVKFFCNDTAGNMNASSLIYFTINTTVAPVSPSVPPPPLPGSGGSGGGGYFSVSGGAVANNKNAYFSGITVPDSVFSGELFMVSGCVLKVDKNSSVELYINGALKNSTNISPPSACFSISGGLLGLGKHHIYLWINGTNIAISKTVSVIAKESKEVTVAEIEILDIITGEAILVGVPTTINVSLRAANPGNVSVTLFSDSAMVGGKDVRVSGDTLVSFGHVFDETGIKTLRVVARAGQKEDIMLKKIVVIENIPTGLFLSESLRSLAAAAIIFAILGTGYYYLVRLRAKQS